MKNTGAGKAYRIPRNPEMGFIYIFPQPNRHRICKRAIIIMQIERPAGTQIINSSMEQNMKSHNFRAANMCILRSGRFCTTVREIFRIYIHAQGGFQICSSEHGQIGLVSGHFQIKLRNLFPIRKSFADSFKPI